MKALVYSSKDIAGTLMAEVLMESHGFKITDGIHEGTPVYSNGALNLVRTGGEAVHAENLNELNYEEIIFLSRHSGASGKATLTAHICGNFGANDLGGQTGKLSTGSANTMRNIFKEMACYVGDHSVSLEVTHHGPYLEIPHCWIELGSNEGQWKDKKAAAFLVDCIMKGMKSDEATKTAIGIGGNHYASVFTKHEGEYAFGHILPKYAQSHLNLKMVEQMISKTTPEPSFIVVDKAGISNQLKVREMLEEAGKEIIVL